jgi:pleuromutilin/lincosamide/streptogramin A transport system ATP-binding/permease protein
MPKIGVGYQMLKELTKITYEIGDRKLLDIKQLQIRQKEKIGLIGRNGSGKTTLLELIAGKRKIQTGSILGDNIAVSLLPQLKQADIAKSGGEITKQYIDQALAQKSDLLLADEPTTNLDTKGIEKLEKTFQRLSSALILVSHDRAFLDAICETIWEIADGTVTVYKGNYTEFRKQKEREIQEQVKAYENYIQKKQQLENALALKERKAERATKKPKNLSSSEARIKGAKPHYAKKQKKLQQVASSIETRLDKLEEVKKISEPPPIKMTIPNQASLDGRIIIRAENITHSFGNQRLWEKASFQLKGGDKIAVIGENGSGKTTFIKKLVKEAPGFTISPAVKLGYFSQNLDRLDPEKTVLENAMETSIQDESTVRTILARLHFFRDAVSKQGSVLSGGERVKVVLAKLMVSDYNVLILDEPTNFLDMHAIEALEKLMADYKGTILFVTHDRKLASQVANRILAFENKQIIDFKGTYEQFSQRSTETEIDKQEQELLVLETKIAEVLSKLSTNPTEALEKEFQNLLKEKRSKGV